MRATFFLVIDVPLVLEYAEEGEHRIVGEVYALGRQCVSDLGGRRWAEVPEHCHDVELSFSEGYAHFRPASTKELVELIAGAV
jgi:hypothetical protein